MTFQDATFTSQRSLGNFNRMIQACDYVAPDQRGVDFAECISVTNPFLITIISPVALKIRENP